MSPIPTCVCGRCVRDPDLDRHRCRGGLSEKMVDAAADAAAHLIGVGYVPIFDTATLRAMWRAGDRELAQQLYELCGGDGA